MNKNRTKRLYTAVRITLGAALLIGASSTALAQRGASAPAEHANITPVNNLPNPYETVRDWSNPSAGRQWGSVSAINIDIDDESVWIGDRCGANSCAGSDLDPVVKLDSEGNVVTSFGDGLTAWT